MTDIIKINPTEFGLTSETALNIQEQFVPMLTKMVELEQEFNEIVCLPVDDEQTSKRAKDLRMKYVKVRTATAEIHKTQKAFYLNGGRFVDGWKNAQAFASQDKENALMQIEKHRENMILKQQKELHESRFAIIQPYILDVNAISQNLGSMEEDVWKAYLSAKKQQFEDYQKAEIEAQKERERIMELVRLHQSRKELLQNEDLWRFVSEDLKAMDFGKMTEKYFNGLLETCRKNKERWESEQVEVRRKLKAEQEEKQRLAEELKAKQAEMDKLRMEEELRQERERKVELERLKAEQKEKKEAEKLAKAPLEKKMKAWVNSFQIPDGKPEHEVSDEIVTKFEAFKEWAKSQIEKI